MKLQKLDISSIYIPTDDFKITDEPLLEKLENVLKKFGQLQPIIVFKENDSYRLIDGTRIYLAALNLGWESLYAIEIPNNLNSEDIALIRVIFTQFKFDYDVIKLISFMHSFMEKYSIADLEKLLPYSEEDLHSYKKLFDFDWNSFSKDSSTPIDIPIKNKKMF